MKITKVISALLILSFFGAGSLVTGCKNGTASIGSTSVDNGPLSLHIRAKDGFGVDQLTKGEQKNISDQILRYRKNASSSSVEDTVLVVPKSYITEKKLTKSTANKLLVNSWDESVVKVTKDGANTTVKSTAGETTETEVSAKEFITSPDSVGTGTYSAENGTVLDISDSAVGLIQPRSYTVTSASSSSGTVSFTASHTDIFFVLENDSAVAPKPDQTSISYTSTVDTITASLKSTVLNYELSLTGEETRDNAADGLVVSFPKVDSKEEEIKNGPTYVKTAQSVHYVISSNGNTVAEGDYRYYLKDDVPPMIYDKTTNEPIFKYSDIVYQPVDPKDIRNFNNEEIRHGTISFALNIHPSTTPYTKKEEMAGKMQEDFDKKYYISDEVDGDENFTCGISSDPISEGSNICSVVVHISNNKDMDYQTINYSVYDTTPTDIVDFNS